MLQNKKIYLIGMNHKTASVEIREKFALTLYCTPESNTFQLCFNDSFSELLFLSTCNRVEILAVSSLPNAKETLIEKWASLVNQPKEILEPCIYSFEGQEAITHLFSVASSLDSLVLGEPQILGQLKSAYRQSMETKSTGAIINRLLHKSFFVAKRVRTETALANSAVSISYAAVELAKRIFDTMKEHDALIIGAGEMAELAALHLKQAGINSLYVANRTYENARALAEKISGIPVPFSEIPQYLAKTDILISSTGSTQPILNSNDIKPILKIRRNKPIFIIDIAMPRDIDPDVNNLDNIYLYDIDDLKEVVEENLAQRKNEALKAEEIIHSETQDFLLWIESLQAQPTIIALNNYTQNIAFAELEKTLKKNPHLDQNTKKDLEIMLYSIIKKVNHQPLTYLKQHHSLETALSNIKKIFGL